MKKLILLLVPWFMVAQIPDYYSTIDFTLAPQNVREQLEQLISTTHTYQLDYTSDEVIDVWDVLKVTELDPTDTTNQSVLMIYGYDDSDNDTMTDRSRDKDLNCTTSGCIGLWNREHVYPRSVANPPLETDDPRPWNRRPYLKSR